MMKIVFKLMNFASEMMVFEFKWASLRLADMKTADGSQKLVRNLALTNFASADAMPTAT